MITSLHDPRRTEASSIRTGDVRPLQTGATLRYWEAHYHGSSGEIEVVPHATVVVEQGARYLADFSLVQARIGHLDVEYTVDLGDVGIPEVRVSHPLAKVTHEAAIGSVDSQQLETLMARGPRPDVAVDVIVRGMLR